MEKKDQISGASLGGAIGDAMGFPFERKENSYTDNGIFFPWIYRSRNRFLSIAVPMEAGSYSDDTQMMLMVARSYRAMGVFDTRHFIAELKEGISYLLGGGRATKLAARSAERTAKRLFPFYDGYAFAGGNGTVMRALPHVLANLSDEKRCIQNGIVDCLMTHGHPHAILAQVFYLTLLFRLLNGDSGENSLKSAKEAMERFSLYESGIPGEWFESWESQTGLSYDSTENMVREYFLSACCALDFFMSENAPLETAFKSFNAFGKEKGSGINTVLAAIYAALSNGSGGMVKCLYPISRMKDCDTDTVASIAGTIYGAIHGIDGIEGETVKIIQDAPYLLEIAHRFSNPSAVTTDRVRTRGSVKDYKSRLDKLAEGDKVKTTLFGPGIVLMKTVCENTHIAKIRFDSGQSITLTKAIR